MYVYQEEVSKDRKMIGASMSYQYVCYQNVQEPDGEKKKHDIIKVPAIGKKEIEGFTKSKFETAGTAGPPTGIAKIDWSYTTHYLATKVDAMPNAVWIWDMTTLELASVLIHQNPVKTFQFSPNSNDLYILTGNSRVFTWAPLGASVIELPQSGFGKDLVNSTQLNKIKWNPNSRNMLLFDKAELLIGIPPSG